MPLIILRSKLLESFLLWSRLTSLFLRALISGIRNNGLKPCHRCLIKKEDLWKLGSPLDSERIHSRRCQTTQEASITRARTAIITDRYAVDSDKYVESELVGDSLTPIQASNWSLLGM